METRNPKSGFAHIAQFYLLGIFSFFILFSLACRHQLIQQNVVIDAPRVLNQPVLNYPKEAKNLNQYGDVELLVLVNVSGKVISSRIVSSSDHAILDNAAMEYVKEVTFVPGEKNGKATAMWVSMTVQFTPQTYVMTFNYDRYGATKIAEIPENEMQEIYNFLKTPYDYGIVLRAQNGKRSVGHPKVFRYQDQWFMSFVLAYNHTLETWLTSSNDLTNWESGNPVLPKTTDSWDANVKIGAVSLINPDLNDDPSPVSYNGSYWIMYLGGSDNVASELSPGIGAAYSPDFSPQSSWHRLDKPVLNIGSQDIKNWMQQSGYRFSLFHDKQLAMGYPFILLSYLTDELMLLGSNDLRNWFHISEQPGWIKLPRNTSDIQMIRVNNLYVLVYTAKNKKLENEIRFACSKDLNIWKHWKGDPLLSRSKDILESCLLNHDDIVYHFYTMKENGNTSIALATSKPLE